MFCLFCLYNSLVFINLFRYVDATSYFNRAYDRVCELSDQTPPAFWEPLVNNLAHTYRKLG